MKTDKTIELHPSWLKNGQILRCLTPKDRAKHKAMSEVIYEALPSKELLIPMTEEEYDDTYTDENEDVVYGIFEDDRTLLDQKMNELLSHLEDRPQGPSPILFPMHSRKVAATSLRPASFRRWMTTPERSRWKVARGLRSDESLRYRQINNNNNQNGKIICCKCQ